jgi:hypothetical protein
MMTKNTTLQILLSIGMIWISSCQLKDKDSSDIHETLEKDFHTNFRYTDNYNSGSCDMAFTSIENMIDTPQIEFGKKKLIKDGSLIFNCKNMEKSKRNLDSLLMKFNGYYEEENLRKNENEIRYYLKLRLPSELFEAFIASLEGGSDELVSKSIDARDITDQYIDVEKRLANQRSQLEQYKELVRQASTVEDIVAVQEHMEELQSNIESKEGKIKLWNDQIALSNITVELLTEFTKVSEPEKKLSIVDRIWNALLSGVDKVVDIVFFFIRIWPFVFLTAFIWWYLKRRKKLATEENKNNE